MRAAVLHAHNTPLAIEELTLDDTGPGEVLVRSVASGLCHSDLLVIEGQRPAWPLPIVLGHETSGIVEQVGSDVVNVAVGDRVVTCSSAFCGRCEWCVKGRPNACVNKGYTRPSGMPPRLTSHDGVTVNAYVGLGGFAEKILCTASAVTRLPDGIPLDLAAVLGCAVVTGIGAVLNTAKVSLGETVAVIGCGGVGLNAIQAAALMNASAVIAVDIHAHKLELAMIFGATHTVDASNDDPVEAVRRITGDGVDHAIEAAGLPSTIEQAFSMLRFGGTATVVGVSADSHVSIPNTALISEKKLQGSLMGSNRFVLDIPRYAQLYTSGKLKLDELLARRIPLDEINDGFSELARSDVARNVVMFDGADTPTDQS